jgi:hypothetical protein
MNYLDVLEILLFVENSDVCQEGLSAEDLIEMKTLTTKERKKLKDEVFGIPSLRKYPLNNAAHVRNAVARFHFCPNKYKTELAKNILKAAKKFDVEVKNEKVLEWAKK